jgi:predicted RNase H-like HicB family nuclease
LLLAFRQVLRGITAIKFYVYKEEPYYVAQCINVDVSSFGDSIEEAIKNLKEAVALYLEDPSGSVSYRPTEDLVIGEALMKTGRARLPNVLLG